MHHMIFYLSQYWIERYNLHNTANFKYQASSCPDACKGHKWTINVC